MNIDCEVNGSAVTLSADPLAPVMGSLRALGLTSVKAACGEGVCGACTVLVDGEPMSACTLPLYAVEGRRVLTTEGLADAGGLSDLQAEFIDRQAFQCGYCTPGFLMSATALLDASEGDEPLTEAEICAGLQGHLCRCGAYPTIVEAIRRCSERRCTEGAQ